MLPLSLFGLLSLAPLGTAQKNVRGLDRRRGLEIQGRHADALNESSRVVWLRGRVRKPLELKSRQRLNHARFAGLCL
jgi:hypothetical protein